MRAKAIVPILVGAIALVGRAGPAWSDEQPEHPKKTGEQPEHPEHPEHPESAVEKEITIERLAGAIEAWVAWDSKLHGGYLLVWDGEQKRTLELKLDKVHREKLSALGDGVYFACADFKATDGSVYDVDVFMSAESSPFEDLWPTSVLVHKKDGAARYTWYEENGTWKRKTR
ncbi:MAG: hypothetical protein ACRDGR_04585 [bacterium]